MTKKELTQIEKAAILKYLRQTYNLSQREVAEVLNLKHTYVSAIEQGYKKPLNFHAQLAQHLAHDLDSIDMDFIYTYYINKNE